MTRPTPTLLANTFQLRGHLLGNTLAQKIAGDETPLRSELFSSSQMEEHGKTLSGLHALSEEYVPERLSCFIAAYQTVTKLRLGELWVDSHHAAPGIDRESQAGCRADCH